MLNERQELFCLEYIKDANATQAAIRAGYNAKNANNTSSRLLANAKVRARIDKLMEEVKSNKIADATEVMEFLTRCMRGEVEEEVVYNSIDGAAVVTKKIGGREQVKAAELMAKRHGLLSENVKLSGNVPLQIIDDLGSGANGD